MTHPQQSGRQAFDNEKYLAEQSEAIKKRISRFDNKLYLEFGGKLMYDYHASRVLPGFDPNVKMRLLQKLKDQVDIILCIFAGDIERRKVRADFGITYDSDTFKLVDDLRSRDLHVQAVVITRFTGQPAAVAFKRKLERRGVLVYTHQPIKGYPADVDRIVSEDGYGLNPYIETTQPLVVVNAPGPNSGKMGTCLSQVYHEHMRGINAGYAKFETFPIWNLPLRHPVNVAYEAATADLKDVNMIDPFHLEAHEATAINYNRDIEAFPLLKRILEKITGNASMYQSPTDMGVNRAGFAIIDDNAALEAAKQELIRRYFRYSCEYAMGLAEEDTVNRVKILMEEFKLDPTDRAVVNPAYKASKAAEQEAGKGNMGVFCGASIQLPNGEIVTGQNSPLLYAASAVVLNSIKELSEIPQHLKIISPNVIESIADLRKNFLNRESVSLNLSETLIALGISSTTNPTARLAMEQLPKLYGCEIHLTHLPSPGDEKALRRLGVNLTSDPQFATNKLFSS